MNTKEEILIKFERLIHAHNISTNVISQLIKEVRTWIEQAESIEIESGFYKVYTNDEEIVAFYNDVGGYWSLHGSIKTYKTDFFDSIGTKVC